MVIAIHPDLIERAVFEAVRTNGQVGRRYHDEFSACYGESPGEARDRAFRELHERWFDALGLRERIQSAVSEFPFVTRDVSRLAFAQAASAKLQSAELFGKPGRFVVVVSISAATLLDEPLLQFWLRHELMHVNDMLDPSFGYDLSIHPTGATPSSRNLGRDRYSLLWAMSIDARITPTIRARSADAGTEAGSRLNSPAEIVAQRRRELACVWGLADSETAGRYFDALWEQFSIKRPTHPELIALSQRMPTEAGFTGAVTARTAAVMPGDPCPACGFKTFDWASGELLERVSSAVGRRLPDWELHHGLCGRCAEVFCMDVAGKRVACVPTATSDKGNANASFC